MNGDETPPIIVTLQLDAASAAFFERQRRTYFPEALNKIGAHLTLFHHLPGEEADAVLTHVAAVCRREPFPLAVTGLMPLGRGVAYRIESETLSRVRAELAERVRGWLKAQDREKFRPHVTVQNKVTPAEARQTRETLEQGFTPFTATAEGLQLWHYVGGPWRPLAATAFGSGG